MLPPFIIGHPLADDFVMSCRYKFVICLNLSQGKRVLNFRFVIVTMKNKG